MAATRVITSPSTVAVVRQARPSAGSVLLLSTTKPTSTGSCHSRSGEVGASSVTGSVTSSDAGSSTGADSTEPSMFELMNPSPTSLTTQNQVPVSLTYGPSVTATVVPCGISAITVVSSRTGSVRRLAPVPFGLEMIACCPTWMSVLARVATGASSVSPKTAATVMRSTRCARFRSADNPFPLRLGRVTGQPPGRMWVLGVSMARAVCRVRFRRAPTLDSQPLEAVPSMHDRPSFRSTPVKKRTLDAGPRNAVADRSCDRTRARDMRALRRPLPVQRTGRFVYGPSLA